MHITSDMLGIAVERASALPIFENSHRKRAANLVGCIGEVVFEHFLTHHGIEFRDDRTSTERDYLIGKSLSLDVKTKDRTVLPRLEFDNSVPLYNHEHQRPDYYYFVSLLRDASRGDDEPGRFTTAYLLGGISRQRLDCVGVEWQAGQTDATNGTKFWTACLNVGMRDLTPNEEMLDKFREAGSPCGRTVLPPAS